MDYEFDHLLTPANTESGIGEFALIAPLSWFAPGGFKKPTGTNPGDQVVTSLTHEFLPNRGWVRFQLAPEKNSYSAETIGTKGFQKFRNNVELFFPGSKDDLHEAIKHLKDVPLVVLVKDSSCNANLYYQVGDNCLGAWLSATFQTGTSAEGEKGYVGSISNHAKSVMLYIGAITMNRPYLPASAGLAVSNLTHNSLRLTWQAVPDATGYILQRSTEPNFYKPTVVYTGALLQFDEAALTPQRTYYYRVLATAPNFNNGRPAVAIATTPAAPVLQELVFNMTLASSSTPFLNLRATQNESVFIRWNPNLAEQEVQLLANQTQVAFNNYAAGTHQLRIRFAANSTLSIIQLTGSGIDTITGTFPAALATLNLGSNNNITAMPALPATITNLNLYGSNLTRFQVSDILVALDAAGLSNGTADLFMAPAASLLTPAGDAAKTALEARGWTITVNT